MSRRAWITLNKRLARYRWIQKTIGVLGAEYLRFVWKTSRFSIQPADFYERAEPQQPLIIAMWHGQHFLVPFLRRHHRVKVLISRHGDGEINAIAAERLGIKTLRGSGDHDRQYARKGGVAAFIGMLEALQQGWNMALTADVPKVSRVAGLGIIALARDSGRPIYPVSFATSRRIVFNSWDRTVLNLPFSRGAIVVGDPVRIEKGSDEATLESARQALETALNEATARAHAIVDRKT